MSLTSRIKEQALSLGFDLVGFTSAEALPKEEAFMKEWLEDGNAGSMEYLHRHAENKGKPQSRLPGAKSVIVLALNYYSEDPPKQNDSVYGKISRYARVPDYHKVIEKKLKALGKFIMAEAGCQVTSRYYVDTGPLFEKALAQRAGLGFIGKNTLLLTKEFGSWVFLAELVVDIDLEYDLPHTGTCGNCTLCVEACPTDALNGDYSMNGSKCIAYYTIENKDEIPETERSKIGEWLFGCDICQEVCPYTRKAQPSEFHTESDSKVKPGSIDVLELLKIRNDEEFREHLSQTPLLRSKRSGLLRNAAIVAGNSNNQEVLSALKDAAQNDPDSLVRSHALWALKEVQHETVS